MPAPPVDPASTPHDHSLQVAICLYAVGAPVLFGSLAALCWSITHGALTLPDDTIALGAIGLPFGVLIYGAAVLILHLRRRSATRPAPGPESWLLRLPLLLPSAIVLALIAGAWFR